MTSPGGEHVYVAGQYDAAVAIFDAPAPLGHVYTWDVPITEVALQAMAGGGDGSILFSFSRRYMKASIALRAAA